MGQALMKEGKLVPTEVTLGLIRKAMAQAEQKTFIIDGFPRAVDQGEAFDNVSARIAPKATNLFAELVNSAEVAGHFVKLHSIGPGVQEHLDVHLVKEFFEDFVQELVQQDLPEEPGRCSSSASPRQPSACLRCKGPAPTPVPACIH